MAAKKVSKKKQNNLKPESIKKTKNEEEQVVSFSITLILLSGEMLNIKIANKPTNILILQQTSQVFMFETMQDLDSGSFSFVYKEKNALVMNAE